MTSSDYVLPERPPVIVWVLAATLLAVGLILSPSLLVALGPMRASLTSENEITKSTAEATVLAARVLSVVAALVCLATAILWRRLTRKKLMLDIASHQPLETDRHGGISTWTNPSLKIMAAGVVVGLCYVALAGRILPDSARAWINQEDGLIEQATAMIFLCCSVMSTILAVKFLKRRRSVGSNASIVWRAGWHGLFGLFFFLCFGEEISWGQRIFGWETIEALKTVNVQDESNLHNLFGYLTDHLFIAGVFGYGALLPLVCLRYPFCRRALDWIGLPVATAGLAVGFLLVSTLHDWSVYRVLPTTAGLRVAEMRELLSVFGFSLLMYESWLLVPASAGSTEGGS